MQRFERLIEVDAPVERVFDLFGDFEGFPRWMRRVREVRRTGPHHTHWVCETALGDVEWEAETTHFEPDRRIVWRSVRGDVDADGEAVFSETPAGTTLVRMVVGYDTPSGRTGPAVARFFGWHPARQLEEDLEQFSRVAARQGERARRSRAGGVRDGERRAGQTRADERGFAREGRRARPRDDDARHDDYGRRDDVREERFSRRDERDDVERRRRFEEALREARRSQLEGEREYARRRALDEERYGRGEGRYRGDEEARRTRREEWEDERPAARGRRRGGDAMDERYGGRGDEARYRTNDEDGGAAREDRPRYAMTPRERERAAGRRYPEPSRGESHGGGLRRGVDRLLDDDPPSRRFGRGRRDE